MSEPNSNVVTLEGNGQPAVALQAQSNVWNLTSQVTGVVFPEETDSVLFFGTHGTGPYCYGTGPECGDTEQPYQGTHATLYRYQVWAYDAQDLADAYSGAQEPEQLSPCDVWELDLPLDSPVHDLTVVAYDEQRGRIFVGQGRAERRLARDPRVRTLLADTR